MITINVTDLKEYLKQLKDPVVRIHINNILNHKETTEQSAMAACVAFLSKFPDSDIPSLCQAMGHVAITDKVVEKVAEDIAAKVEADLNTTPEGKQKKVEPPAVQEGDTEPVAEEGSSVQQRYTELYSYKCRPKETRFGCTDAKLASMCLVLFGEDNCLQIQETASWFRWIGHKWQECAEGHIRQMLDRVAILVEQDLKETRKSFSAVDTKDKTLQVLIKRYKFDIDEVSWSQIEALFESEMDRMQAMVARLESYQGRNAIVTLMGDRLIKKVDQLDSNKDEIVFTNCSWNAKNNNFYPNRRASFATRSVDRQWEEPSKEAVVNWDNYLGSLGFDEKTLTFLKRSFGYALLGRGTGKRFWWFRGETNTSKTTLVQLVSRAAGSYVETTQAKMWLMSRTSSNGHTDDTARLRGCRMVTADEFPKVGRFSDDLLKQITGASPVSASRKGEKGITFDVTFAPFFSSNYDPYIAEDDTASFTRLTALTFKNVVKDVKKEFVNDYINTGDNVLAILKWCMDGAVEYVQHGFGEEPDEVKLSREEYQQEQISIADQLACVVEADASSRLFFSEIHVALCTYQDATRQRVQFSKKQLSKVIKSLFNLESTPSTKGQVRYTGLRLIPPPQKWDPRIDNGYRGRDEDDGYVSGEPTVPHPSAKSKSN
jgi:P4 family phage/plasmid primase-like protien